MSGKKNLKGKATSILKIFLIESICISEVQLHMKNQENSTIISNAIGK